MAKQQGLAGLFEPPHDILFTGSFDEAKEAAQGQNRWLVTIPCPCPCLRVRIPTPHDAPGQAPVAMSACPKVRGGLCKLLRYSS